MSYICISYAEADNAEAQRFCRRLTMYGFRYECLTEDMPLARRETLLDGCATLLVLTSPAAEESISLVSDLRRQRLIGAPVACVSLLKNQLDERFCAHEGAGMTAIPYPFGETETPDERSVALFIHRLYISRLCRLTACFSPSRCVDDLYGRVIARGVGAWSGDGQAQYDLGMAYAEGDGVPALESETAYWMRKAAKAEIPRALIRMGELLLDGEGVEKDHAEALHLFSAAARAGEARGHFYKGICCLYGYGLMKDPEMAVRYLKAAADMGYAPALYRLGLLYRDGIGTEASWRRAVDHLYRAVTAEGETVGHGWCGILRANAAADAPTAQRRRFVCVSMRFMRQRLMKQGNRPKLRSFGANGCRARRINYPEDGWLYGLDTAYDSSRYNKNRGYSHQRWDVALAEGALGRLLELGSPAEGIKPRPVAAFGWYRRAMRHGHSGAMFRLGDAYRSGRGVPRDASQAVCLFRRSAEFGNVRGQFAMGVCCELGQGLPASMTEAVRWYELAADAGYAPAQNNLGGCYEYGRGVSADMLTAVEWYTRASAQGQPDAACRLGLCYEMGRGVPKNEERAFHLFEDAARAGQPYALYRLGLCYDLGISVAPQVAYAAHLYERAARGGVAEAAYAMALCCRGGRGVRKNGQESFEWLKTAAELGSIQGGFELGLCYFEGKTTLQNRALAITCFRRVVSLYQAMTRTEASRVHESSDKRLPVDCMTAAEAVGGSLYMLGYGAMTDEKPDPVEALRHFEAAAAIERYEAMTAIGDMYAYGLLGAGSYEKNEETAQGYYETAAKGGDTNALLSLAVLYEKKGQAANAAGDLHEAAVWRERAWRSLARCAEQGHAYALIGMAGCAWMGHGTQQNREIAKWFLERANRRQERHVLQRHADLLGFPDGEQEAVGDGNALASLWLGDLYLNEMEQADALERTALIEKAQAAYETAIRAPLRLREIGPYALPARVEIRKRTELAAKAEAHYRLAALEMQYAITPAQQIDAFTHLGEAVLAGHEAAVDDLARLYAHAREATSVAGRERPVKSAARGRQPSVAPQRAESFGREYYCYLGLRPQAFYLGSPVSEPAEDAPSYVTVPVTNAMRAAAVNHLGDRYFYGDGLPEDKISAVTCYRRAARTVQAKGEPVEGGIVWAQYSLGYCLLTGAGTRKAPREAVLWLSRAAKYHGDAAYCLAECYETGVGVDSDDTREALKLYRKALKLGCAAAEARIPLLERKLREEE